MSLVETYSRGILLLTSSHLHRPFSVWLFWELPLQVEVDLLDLVFRVPNRDEDMAHSSPGRPALSVSAFQDDDNEGQARCLSSCPLTDWN
jgi:hypothetical protein